jgi:hypothetical protein
MGVLDPTQYSYIPRFNIAMCYLGLGDVYKAYQWYQEALKIAPTNPTLTKARELFEEGIEMSDLFKSFFFIKNYLEKHDPKLLFELPKIISDKMLNDERFYGLKQQFTLPVTWEKDSVAIFCGKAYEDWADPSVMLGIGGSEEAVIYMSRELVKLGKKVVVFNECGELKGKYNGVEYKPYHQFNRNDNFDTVIFWRGIPFNVEAKRRFVWLHDVPMGMFTEKNKDWFFEILTVDDTFDYEGNPIVSKADIEKEIKECEKDILAKTQGIYLNEVAQDIINIIKSKLKG